MAEDSQSATDVAEAPAQEAPATEPAETAEVESQTTDETQEAPTEEVEASETQTEQEDGLEFDKLAPKSQNRFQKLVICINIG